MVSMSTELEVFETVRKNGALELASALSRPHSNRRSGVVSADFSASNQGTGLSFAGVVDGIAVGYNPREGDPSGTRAWSPPV